MLTKGRAHSIKQLHEKKYRQDKGLFLVEGEKGVAELLTSDYAIESIYVTAQFRQKYKDLLDTRSKELKIDYDIVEQKEIENIGTLETNNAALAVVKQKKHIAFTVEAGEIALALDSIRDPGNLGTIIRIADWYGIKKIIASPTTTDFYNSKAISATMGSFTRVQLFYTDLKEFISQTNVPILGAFLKGENVHTFKFPKEGILIIGNESNGISEDIESVIKHKVTIPSFGQTESLNASIATAVIIDNWKRNL